MQSPSPPPAPDPVATANAQQNLNQNTATTQQLLNMTNQVTPQGSLTYNQTGSNSFTGADGKTYTVPQFTATQTLSPTEQKLFDLNTTSRTNLGNAGVTATGKINGILGSNINLSNDAVENRLFDLGTRRLTPQFQRDEDSLRTQLINSGIRPGSDAWRTEMTRLDQKKNDALDQLVLGGHHTAARHSLTERNQPLNEITALMSGSQVQNPAFASTPQASVAGTDYAGMVRDNYNAAQQNYQAQLQQNNAMLGGLFGLGGTLGGMGIYKYSDRRLKDDIKRVGTLDNGLPVYVFRYKGDDGPTLGLMADEVEKVNPEAVVTHRSGFKMVDYGRAVRA